MREITRKGTKRRIHGTCERQRSATSAMASAISRKYGKKIERDENKQG
jgi:hypothetical protein